MDVEPEPRIAAYNSARQRNGRVLFFGVDVTELEPGEAVTMGAEALSYPYERLSELAPDEYHV